MAWPADLFPNDIIDYAWHNSVKNSVEHWLGNVDGEGFDLINVGNASFFGQTSMYGRLIVSAPNSAPNDANLSATQISFYMDESGNNLKVRVRYSNGTTLKTGTLALV